MLYGIYLSTAGALAEESRQDILANNLANASTPGFKADTPVFRTRLAEAMERPMAARGSRDPLLEQIGGGASLDEVRYSPKPGSLETSSNPFDLALQGDGYFRVGDASGEYYTRAGNFQRSPEGFLTTVDGSMKVLNDRGRPIRLPEGTLVISDRGEVSVDGTPVGRLGLSSPSIPGGLQKVGATLYRDAGNGAPVPAAPSVRQNFLERSTVNPIHEMVRLIQSQRAYEANLQMIRIQDSTLEKAVNGIAKVSV